VCTGRRSVVGRRGSATAAAARAGAEGTGHGPSQHRRTCTPLSRHLSLLSQFFNAFTTPVFLCIELHNSWTERERDVFIPICTVFAPNSDLTVPTLGGTKAELQGLVV
jgi:hypothetical protein